MPFTGRLACLPPRCVEVAYSWLGLASAALYPARAAGRGSGSDHHVACEASAPILQHLYSCLRAAGEEEAARGGRAVAFAGPSAESVHAIPSTRTGATCLPGGIVFVHSGLLRCIWASLGERLGWMRLGDACRVQMAGMLCCAGITAHSSLLHPT